jgi:SAM-dependent methyltransferase
MRRDHHDWSSEAYVDEWVRRQRADDHLRSDRFALMCDLFPFSRDAAVTILDLGAGYGPVSAFILERYPRAVCVGQDGSEPMLAQARTMLAGYGARFVTHRSDLFDPGWLPRAFAPFDAAVTSACLHNLRSFGRIAEIYREVREHLKPGAVFLNVDLINAPTATLHRRYLEAAAAQRRREPTTGADVSALVRGGDGGSADQGAGPFPADLDQHLAALKAAGFTDVDCFWKDLRRALFGGYA